VVYEATVVEPFEATLLKRASSDDLAAPQQDNISNGQPPLFFYSEISELLALFDTDEGSITKKCQFIWSDSNYTVATGDALVTSGDSYEVELVWEKS